MVTKRKPAKRKIGIELEGEELERFEKYKERVSIKRDAPAGYKLLIERLRQVEQQPPATV